MMDSTNNIICELRGVSFDTRLPGGRELKVLDNVNLVVSRGHITAILGPSGCGKSTLVRILTGLARPGAGEVLVHGQSLDGLNSAVSFVFQGFALYPWLSTAENIAMGLNGRVTDAVKQKELVARAIDRVGLEGFEEAYPRELSAGMKKRVGIARALVAQSELLVMDEPFSGLDVLTADNLRGEVIHLWQDTTTDPSSVLMVTNNIIEAVFMATRIVVMGANPGRIRAVLDNPLAYPRVETDPAFVALAGKIRDILTTTYLPDESVAPPTAVPPTVAAPVEPMPNVNMGEMLGLLDLVREKGGTADLFDLAVEIGKEFGRVLALAKAAELLGFADTPKHTVVLTPLGRALVVGKINARKKLINQQLRQLRLVQHLLEILGHQPDFSVDEDIVLEELAVLLPTEKPQTMFKALVRWGRYAELLGYNANERRLYLDVESSSGQQPSNA